MTQPEDSNLQIGFSQVREDPNVELAVAEELAERLGRPVRALVVGSGGCTALSLLSSPSVDSVDAVDLNPAQLYLIELRRVVVEQLSGDEQLAFIGELEVDNAAAMRTDVYARLRPHLSDSARAFWDARPALIAGGIQHCGRFESMLSELRREFDDAGIDPLMAPAKALGSDAFRHAFTRVFEAGRMQMFFGAAMTAYSAGRTFAFHFMTAVADAMRRFGPEDSYFLRQVLDRKYGDGKDRPPYLLENRQDVIRTRDDDALTLHHAPFVGKMLELAEGQPFDLIHTSDLTDWIPVRDAHAFISNVKRSLGEQGAVVSRRLNGDHHLGRLISTHMTIDAAMSARLKEMDRSFLYSELVVASPS